MSDDYFECPQVSGKTIKALRIYKDTGDGTEVLIDLTDGTSFTFSLSIQPTLEAAVIRPGVGEPEILHRYDLERISQRPVIRMQIISNFQVR